MSSDALTTRSAGCTFARYRPGPAAPELRTSLGSVRSCPQLDLLAPGGSRATWPSVIEDSRSTVRPANEVRRSRLSTQNCLPIPRPGGLAPSARGATSNLSPTSAVPASWTHCLEALGWLGLLQVVHLEATGQGLASPDERRRTSPDRLLRSMQLDSGPWVHRTPRRGSARRLRPLRSRPPIRAPGRRHRARSRRRPWRHHMARWSRPESVPRRA